MQLLALLCALSAVSLVIGQTPSNPHCNEMTTSAVHEAIWNAVNTARSMAANLDHRNPLTLVEQLSFVGSWQIDKENWNDNYCPGYLHYYFDDTFPAECCPRINGITTDCTAYTMDPDNLETKYSYVGALVPDSPIDETNAAEIIPTLLQAEPFSFLLGIPPVSGTLTPNPPLIVPPKADKLGIGLNSDGLRLVLIMGDELTTKTYTPCLVPSVVTTTTETMTTSSNHLGSTSLAPGITTSLDPSDTIPNGANNLGVGSVALGVAWATYLNL